MATSEDTGWVWKRFPFNGFVIANLVRNGAALAVRHSHFAFDTGGLVYSEERHVYGARPVTWLWMHVCCSPT